jgi:transcriptional regulator of heat shock response
MSPKSSAIIREWKKEFDKCYSIGEDKCRENIINSGIDITKTIQDNNYLTMHAIINKLYLENKINKDKIKINEASDSMFNIQDKFDWDHDKVVEHILSDEFNKDNHIYMIKFTKHTRYAFDTDDKINRYKEKIGKI